MFKLSVTKNRPVRNKIFYGWWITAAASILYFLCGGTFYYGFSVFFNPIRNTFHWTATQTSAAFTLRGLETGVLGPLAGILVDKVGPRKLMVAGWGIVGLGFLLLSRINSLPAFYGTFMLIAVGMSFGTGVVITTALANWFTKKRSRAMAIMFVGPGISGLLAPLFALLIGWTGWRDTLTIIGIGLLLTGVPLSLLFRHKPEQYGYLPDGENKAPVSQTTSKPNFRAPHKIGRPNSSSLTAGFTAKEALRTRAFWLLSFVDFFQQMGASAVMVHIVAYLESVKVTTSIAAVAVTGMTLCSLIGRIGIGFLGDFTDKRYLIALSLGLQTTGLILFSLVGVDKMWILILFLLTFGPGFGGLMPLRPALQADYFGTKSFGTITGLMSVIATIGGLASPIFAGWIFDSTDSYRLAWQIFAVISLPGIPLVLLTHPPKSSNTVTLA
ncbi:MAG: MFS transporter [Dehalococcoidales bacterium]|nr:MFS transporter [Dehalococcoidales bacterium]